MPAIMPLCRLTTGPPKTLNQNNVAAAVDFFEAPQHFDGKFFDFGALKHAARHAAHPAFDFRRANDFALLYQHLHKTFGVCCFFGRHFGVRFGLRRNGNTKQAK